MLGRIPKHSCGVDPGFQVAAWGAVSVLQRNTKHAGDARASLNASLAGLGSLCSAQRRVDVDGIVRGPPRLTRLNVGLPCGVGLGGRCVL